MSVLKFISIWCLCLNLCIWLTCEPASCHHVFGWSPGAIVYIIPQHAPSARASRARFVVAMRTAKQQGNRAAATRAPEYFRMGGWSLLVICLSSSLSAQVSFGCISEVDLTHWKICSLNSLSFYQFIQGQFQKKHYFTIQLWKWSYHNDKPSRLKRRWVTILDFLLLFGTRSLWFWAFYNTIHCIWALEAVRRQ